LNIERIVTGGHEHRQIVLDHRDDFCWHHGESMINRR
jgi:hypothetical protein